MGALSDLTDANAVSKAIEEFKALGRDAFLEKYGLRASVKYSVEVDGLLIDSKPLLSVAYGYQYPEQGPLPVSYFSGGAETRRALSRFGYKLSPLPSVMYGEVPGYPPGSVLRDRMEAYRSGVHRTSQAGIAGQAEGTQSICLSDGYSEDEIQGDLISYTGFGGQNESRTRQIADQKLEKGNLGLVKNYKLGRPVRVLAQKKVFTGRKSDKEYIYLGLFTVIGWGWGTADGYKILVYQLRAVAADSLIPGDVTAALTRGEEVPPQRRTSTVNRIVRNYDVAASVKRLYNDTCQICSTRLLTPAGPYSEGAHIRPLGIPHNGPDTLANILCLCPNCHKLLDGHALTLRPDGTVLYMGEVHGQLTIASTHQLDREHLMYHQQISASPSQG